jgi:hypothetical protein
LQHHRVYKYFDFDWLTVREIIGKVED